MQNIGLGVLQYAQTFVLFCLCKNVCP